VQTGPIDEYDVADIAFHSVREAGSEHHEVPAQPSYTEARSAAIALHHVRVLSGLDQINLREDIKEYIKFCPTCQKMSYIRPTIHSIPYVSSGTNVRSLYRLRRTLLGGQGWLQTHNLHH
jgi:hypothetical protein